MGKSDTYMLDRVRETSWHYGWISVVTYRSGSFSSLAAANSLVNATLAKNRDIVQAVASDELSRAFVTAEFDAPTGREAYRTSSQARPYIRSTTGVGVYIVHDPSFGSGYRIQTAYPRSD